MKTPLVNFSPTFPTTSLIIQDPYSIRIKQSHKRTHITPCSRALNGTLNLSDLMWKVQVHTRV